jgi:hypothetical protein
MLHEIYLLNVYFPCYYQDKIQIIKVQKDNTNSHKIWMLFGERL